LKGQGYAEYGLIFKEKSDKINYLYRFPVSFAEE
jgi:hypothetical protein